MRPDNIITQNFFPFRNEKAALLLIFIVALALRLFAVIGLQSQSQPLYADEGDYDTMAVNLLAGKGYIHSSSGLPTSSRPPLYVLFLSFIYSIFGHNYLAVRIIQCFMVALLCPIIFYIAKFAFNVKIALLAAAIMAFYKPFIFHSFWGGPLFLLSENLFTFLFALFLLSLSGFFKDFSLKDGILSGILFSLTTLCRPLTVFFPLVIFALLFRQKEFLLRYKLSKFSSLLICFILVLLPWWIRNYSVHKAFVPLTTKGGYVLLSSNHPDAKGGGHTHIESLLTQEERFRLGGMSEVEQDRMYRDKAIEFLRREYKKVPALFLRKLMVLWDPYSTYYAGNVMAKRHYNIFYSTILIFALWGIVKSIKSGLNIPTLSLISVFLYFSAIAMVFTSEPRFRYPVEPYLIIFSAAGISAIYKFRNILIANIIIAAIAGINILIYFKSDLMLNLIRRFW